MLKYEKPIVEIIDLTPSEAVMLELSGEVGEWDDEDGVEEW